MVFCTVIASQVNPSRVDHPLPRRADFEFVFISGVAYPLWFLQRVGNSWV